MKTYAIYDKETGRVVSVNTCPASQFMPKQGPLASDPNLVVKHGACCPINDRVEHGRFVPVGMQQKRALHKRTGWAAFKLARERLLLSKDYLLAAHYPASEEEKQATAEKFQRARDLPKMTNDPEEALALLNEIWSTT